MQTIYAGRSQILGVPISNVVSVYHSEADAVAKYMFSSRLIWNSPFFLLAVLKFFSELD